MKEVEIDWNAYVVGGEVEDPKYYPVINPETKLEKPIFSLDSKKYQSVLQKCI